MNPETQKLIARVKLAIEANDGPDYNDLLCECQEGPGATKCPYCAIRDALNETLRYLKTYVDIPEK